MKKRTIKEVKLTKGVVTREEAMKLAPDYVAFVEGDHGKYDVIDSRFSKLTLGKKVLTCSSGVFVLAKVSGIDHDDFRAVDGPVVRVSNGEYSWRVDGNDYAWPVK